MGRRRTGGKIKNWDLVKGGSRNNFEGKGTQKHRVYENRVTGARVRITQVYQPYGDTPYYYYVDSENESSDAWIQEETTNQREAISLAVDWMRRNPAP